MSSDLELPGQRPARDKSKVDGWVELTDGDLM
jgi:hypothetical protein